MSAPTLSYPYVDPVGTAILINAAIVPYSIDHQLNQTISRTEDGKLKVYSQAWAGSYKRIWTIKCIADDTCGANYYADYFYLLAFYRTASEGAKNQIKFTDSDGNSFKVRIIDFTDRVIGRTYHVAGIGMAQTDLRHEVTIILEEDYS
jgi:hypothetical protein